MQAGTNVGDCVTVAFTGCPGVDLAGQSLQGAFLGYADLTGADFTLADLIGANLDGAIFCSTLMPDASVRNPVNGPCPGG